MLAHATPLIQVFPRIVLAPFTILGYDNVDKEVSTCGMLHREAVANFELLSRSTHL